MPIIAVVTNIDRDHLDTYGSFAAISDAFVDFLTRVPFFGRIVACLDDPNVQAILPQLVPGHRVTTYGLTPQADLVAEELETTPAGSRFAVRHAADGELGTIELPMHGRHNVQNALAAVAVGRAHRRFERLGTWRGAAVVDDYAHHPTEVTATLQAARLAFPKSRVHAVFQPHLFSRTRDLCDDFARSLLEADTVLVTAIYPSREAPIAGVSGEDVVAAARESGHRRIAYCADWRQAAALLAERVAGGDVVITMGAGDIYRLAQDLVAAPAATEATP
jgi:UDP-N-acetylmuramate--alanine ligase